MTDANREGLGEQLNSQQNDPVVRLSEESYWDAVYLEQKQGVQSTSPKEGLLRQLYKRLWGQPGVWGFGYPNYVMDHVVLYPHFPRQKEWSVLEVGSAPGRRLLGLHQHFCYDPYGVEYSESGARINRDLFLRNGLPAEHVIHADFFSDEFLGKYRESFDVVYSCGFIEHFENPREVIRRHLDLLKVGGKLLIEIPNLRGINYWLSRFFHPEVLSIHNLEIMEMETFREAFNGLPLVTDFCGYVGVFSLGLQNADPASLKRHVLRGALLVDNALALCLRRILGPRGPEHRWLSPYLVYVGTKASS